MHHSPASTYNEVRALEKRFSTANRRFALDFGVSADGVLFRDPGPRTGPRRNVACWEAFDADLRDRVRAHVMAEIGIDLDGGAWNRQAVLVRRATVTLAWRARMAGRRVRSQRRWLAR